MTTDAYRESEAAAELYRWIKGTLGGRYPARCRKCNAEIWFAQVLKKDGNMGAVMPLDLGVHFDGNLTPVGGHDRGIPLVRDPITVTHDPKGIYRSHFQSCPSAKSFRNPRKKGKP